MNIRPLQIAWADSRGKTIAVLLVLLAATLLYQFRVVFLWHVLVSLILSVLIDSSFFWLHSKKRAVSLSSVITGLLIGLVFDPLGGFVPAAAACLLASVSKYVIGKGPHKHIFNPAAFGIVVSSFLFNRPVAWWGASWGIVPVIIIGVGMLPIVWRLRRLWMPLTFLAVYFGSLLLHGTFASAVRLTLDGTVFFFVFVMLPEPKTAPLVGKWIWGWGIFVGLFVLIQGLIGIAIVDPLLLALLAANFFRFLSDSAWSWFRRR